jgi:hypothetical protein
LERSLRIFVWEWFPPLPGVGGVEQRWRGLGGLEDSEESVMEESGEPNGDGIVREASDSSGTTGSKS